MRLIAAALLIAGNQFYCATSPGVVAFGYCPDNNVTVHVAPGVNPMFSWSPSCGISGLTVFVESDVTALWTVNGSASANDNPIESGVRYGQTPADARTVTGPLQLQRGVAYRVQVRRLICERGSPCYVMAAGETRFQP
ncbi:MAG TPA: hypothetical protein VKD28_03225 [Gemmatimonadales bacterium]|nr:hypothetical protein [Gemmatimonadales bacterium]